MIKKLEAVIFDYDGTIVDTEKAYFEVMKDLIKEHFDEEIDKEDYIINVSGTSAEQCEHYITKKYNVNACKYKIFEDDVKKAMYRRLKNISVLPGIEEVFSLLKENDIKIGIASNGNLEHIVRGLKDNNLYNYVDDIVTKYDVERGKPYPDIYIHVADRLGVNIENCVAVEDSKPGAIAAANSGAYLILQTNEITNYFDFSDVNYREKDCNLYEVIKKLLNKEKAMYIAKSSLDKGFTVKSTSTNNQNYILEMNDTQDGPMDLFTVAFSGCILMCVKGYFFRKYNLKNLPIDINLTVDYDNKKYSADICVDYKKLSEDDKLGILENINLRCKISHLLSDDIIKEYTIKTK